MQTAAGLFLSLLIKTFATLILQFPLEDFKTLGGGGWHHPVLVERETEAGGVRMAFGRVVLEITVEAEGIS